MNYFHILKAQIPSREIANFIICLGSVLELVITFEIHRNTIEKDKEI